VLPYFFTSTLAPNHHSFIFGGKRAVLFMLRHNFANGFRYVATFDLTAFYDSIDHHVLKIFLLRSGIDVDTIGFLLTNLGTGRKRRGVEAEDG
jgi:hypothetical protein